MGRMASLHAARPLRVPEQDYDHRRRKANNALVAGNVPVVMAKLLDSR